jgi:TldD protein
MGFRVVFVGVLAAALGAGALGAPAKTDPPAAKNRVLTALEEEMKRSVEGLKAKGDPAPYFISYCVTEREAVELSTSRGALRLRSSNRTRVLEVDVRVGDYGFDNTRRMRGEHEGGGGRGHSRLVRLPLEDDDVAIRQAIWLETDRNYKQAVESYIRVKANAELKTREEEESGDFSKETPERYEGPVPPFSMDVDAWEKTLKEVSRTFRAYPLVYEADAALTAERVRRYFVSSAGAVISDATVDARVFLLGQTKAEDGQDLFRFESFEAHAPEHLPDRAALTAAAESISKDLLALRQAPLIEPYTGPAILSGRAAGVFFHEIFGHRIEGHRQKGEEEGQTFTKKINTAVLPDFLTVLDDPTREKLGGTDLNGFYLYDDEGVKARRVAVVQSGVLKTFLMSRTPVPGFDHSNGHGRRQVGFNAVGRQGNLIVETSAGVPEQKLKALLVEECKKQGKPFGLLFSDISGGFTLTARSAPQAYQVNPVMVYRVYTDGRPDELVRGADLIGTPLVSFSKILAAGDTPAVFNGHCGAESGWVPVSAVSPSILTAQIEIQKQEKSTDRPPLLPPPPEDKP